MVAVILPHRAQPQIYFPGYRSEPNLIVANVIIEKIMKTAIKLELLPVAKESTTPSMMRRSREINDSLGGNF